MPAEALKEYLVKLGWDVDELGLNAAEKIIGDFANSLTSDAGKISSGFLSAGGAVLSFVATTTVAMGKLLFTTAQADLEIEQFARKMWTTETAARSFLTALDAMGASYEDIFYMTPEEYGRLMELKNLGLSLEAPKELQEGLVLIRDIGHEFNKLKVLVGYATQWVSYYLLKYIGDDLERIHEGFEDFNGWVEANIPSATEKIAKFFEIIFKLAIAGATAIKDLATMIKDLWDSLSYGSKVAATAIVGFVGLFQLGPIGMFIAAMLAILALLDDFYTWQRGGKSAFGETWASMADGFGFIDTSMMNEAADTFDKLLLSVYNLGVGIFETSADIIEFLDEIGALDALWRAFVGTMDALADILQTIADLLLVITGNFDSLSENSVFRKILKVDENGNTDTVGTVANAGMALLDSFPDTLNKVLGSNEGDWWHLPNYSEAFGYNYGNSSSTSEAVKSVSGSGLISKLGASLSQLVTININGYNVKDAETIAARIAESLYEMRDNNDMFK